MSKKLILKKIMSHLNIHKDYLFADFLGISQSTLANWFKRDVINYELIISKCDFLNANWLLTGKGSMLKSSAPDSAVVNEPETPYYTNTATNTVAKTEELQQKIIALQEKLIEARDKFLDKDKKLFELQNDFIASQKKILELTDQNQTLNKKYNSLKESILSKNNYNMFTDSKLFKEVKKKFNHAPIDLVLMFMWGNLLL